MSRLVPTDELLKIVGGYENLKEADIEMLGEKFGVLNEVIMFKMFDLIEKENTKRKKDRIKKKILKKEGNKITVNFN